MSCVLYRFSLDSCNKTKMNCQAPSLWPPIRFIISLNLWQFRGYLFVFQFFSCQTWGEAHIGCGIDRLFVLARIYVEEQLVEMKVDFGFACEARNGAATLFRLNDMSRHEKWAPRDRIIVYCIIDDGGSQR